MRRSRPQSALSGLRALLAARREKEEKERNAGREKEITNSLADTDKTKEKQKMEDISTTKNMTIEDNRMDSPSSTIHSLTISEFGVKINLKANGTHHTGDSLKN